MTFIPITQQHQEARTTSSCCAPAHPAEKAAPNGQCQSHLITDLNNTGASLLDTHRYEEAHATLSKALTLCKRLQQEQQQRERQQQSCSRSCHCSASSTSCQQPTNGPHQNSSSSENSCCRFVEVDYSYVNIFLAECNDSQQDQQLQLQSQPTESDLFNDQKLSEFRAPLLLRTVSTCADDSETDSDSDGSDYEDSDDDEDSSDDQQQTMAIMTQPQHSCSGCCRIDEHASLLSFVVVYNLAICFHLIGLSKLQRRTQLASQGMLTQRNQAQLMAIAEQCLRKALHLYEIAHAFYNDQEQVSSSAESVMDCIMLMRNITAVHRTLGNTDRASKCQCHLLQLSFVWLNMFNDDIDDEEYDDIDVEEDVDALDYGGSSNEDNAVGAGQGFHDAFRTGDSKLQHHDMDIPCDDDIEMDHCLLQDDIQYRTIRQVLRNIQSDILREQHPCLGHHVATAA